MKDRGAIAHELAEIELELKELEILFEQYFAGVEKREPLQERQSLARRLRQLANRHISQTDLRFRYQNLATRFHSYGGHWDRILRLMDEGRYHRQHWCPLPKPAKPAVAEPAGAVERIYRELLQAHQACKLRGPLPERQKVAQFLEQQEEKIREKFGNREVEFRVETDGGKPKIKVRAKQ